MPSGIIVLRPAFLAVMIIGIIVILPLAPFAVMIIGIIVLHPAFLAVTIVGIIVVTPSEIIIL
jgi:hypothetical protein